MKLHQIWNQLVVSLASAMLLSSVAFASQTETVYTMSNDTQSNEVLIFERRGSGNLHHIDSVATGGQGTGGSLGNQSGVVLDPSDRWLFAANAGNGTITSFRVLEEGLTRIDTDPSGGFSPISIAVFGTWVFVLNEGDPNDPGNPDNISGFRLNLDGTLSAIPDSTRPLSAPQTDPAQISFNKEGTVLFVTEKATNMLTTYTVDADGVPSHPLSRPSAIPTPFGFQFGDRDVVYVSEANQGGPGAVVSYRVNRETGEVSGAIGFLDAENATCWVVLSNDQTIGYASNTGSASISPFSIAFDGTIEPLLSNGRSIETGNGPLDIVLTQDGENLYSLDSGDNTITAFRVRRNGNLVQLGTVDVPPGANGLAAR
ncbi:MAG: hypothetical protein ETSY1_19600 [Candidatus Entotheonella factor]|uniref:3-carboxymuconate cyclase n=2 Tax=Candidatus Entotheonella TaxID=93171 RepID=W4LLJ0_ENTF1|nr:MAG: hypothetical protein ETSY1_19600 [Candidatus Entotheonella factor]